MGSLSLIAEFHEVEIPVSNEEKLYKKSTAISGLTIPK